jgi:hypothetical protein
MMVAHVENLFATPQVFRIRRRKFVQPLPCFSFNFLLGPSTVLLHSLVITTTMAAPVEEIRATSYVGFDSITQQIEHKLLKRGFQFNVIVVGALIFYFPLCQGAERHVM